MLIPELDHRALIKANEEEYGRHAASMRWLSPQESAQAGCSRGELLEDAVNKGSFLFNNTKPYHIRISPGCRLCGEGTWSCLFINNLCNAGCFFCPAQQDNQDEPGTSTLTFTEPEAYADYLEEFGFKGASISGGEPLLAFEKTLSFVSHLKKRYGEDLYLWLYTNGTLATADIMKALADAGLNEVRFNITATGYDLSMARMASRFIGNVTVEIPAVPEDTGIMKAKISEMADSGISFLNLHQIRCTKHNVRKLMDRGYTFAHGPQIGVVESELAALCLLNHAMAQGIPLGVNYCSLIYRHRFQTRSSRLRWAPLMAKPFEDVTEAGLIRMVRIEGRPEIISGIEAGLARSGCDPAQWSSNTDKTRLSLSGDLLRLMDPLPESMRLSYAIVSVRPGITYSNPFKEIRLASGKKIVLERATAYLDLELSGDEIALFRDAFTSARGAGGFDALHPKSAGLNPSEQQEEKWQKIIQAEKIRAGLLEYY